MSRSKWAVTNFKLLWFCFFFVWLYWPSTKRWVEKIWEGKWEKIILFAVKLLRQWNTINKSIKTTLTSNDWCYDDLMFSRNPRIFWDRSWLLIRNNNFNFSCFDHSALWNSNEIWYYISFFRHLYFVDWNMKKGWLIQQHGLVRVS